MSETPGPINQYKLFIETTGNLHTTARVENGIIHLTIAQPGADSPLLSSHDETFCEVIKDPGQVVNPASMTREPFLSFYEQEIESIKIRVVRKAMQQETKQRPEPIQSKKVRQAGEWLAAADLELDPFRSLARIVDNLHLQVTLDVSREKILKILGRRSWQGLSEEVSKQGMTLQNYIYTSLSKDPANALSWDIVDFICRNRRVPGEYPKISIEELYDFANVRESLGVQSHMDSLT